MNVRRTSLLVGLMILSFAFPLLRKAGARVRGAKVEIVLDVGPSQPLPKCST